jgi:hypothetical protein
VTLKNDEEERIDQKLKLLMGEKERLEEEEP